MCARSFCDCCAYSTPNPARPAPPRLPTPYPRSPPLPPPHPANAAEGPCKCRRRPRRARDTDIRNGRSPLKIKQGTNVDPRLEQPTCKHCLGNGSASLVVGVVVVLCLLPPRPPPPPSSSMMGGSLRGGERARQAQRDRTTGISCLPPLVPSTAKHICFILASQAYEHTAFDRTLAHFGHAAKSKAASSQRRAAFKFA